MTSNYPLGDKIPGEQQSSQPGIQSDMGMQPESTKMQSDGVTDEEYRGNGLLQDKVALITGGDSGIGRSVAVQFAREGAQIAIVFLPEEEKDARDTEKMVKQESRECMLISADIGFEKNCKEIVEKVVQKFDRIDILVNNAAYQMQCDNIEDLKADQIEHTFRTNIFSMFYLSKHALPHMKRGSNIINSTSVTAYKGASILLDYSSTKGAIVAFTRSLSQQLVEKGIRVNGVAPGPVWTPFIPSSMSQENVSEFGGQVPMKRPGQPAEIATSYVFLASNRASYITGQILHPNGGSVVNG